MSSSTRSELIRLGVTLVPALGLVAVGCLASAVSPLWLGLAIGGGLAALLVMLGGLMVAATHRSALHVAAFAALASFVVRIGGAGAAALAIDGKTWSLGAIIGLAGGLLAALALDLWTWFRVARTDALMTSAKESARA
ncbi:MAG TPA: hypothetical protein VHX44_20045 [Planctomycetota bacterium]|jgi:hypothetical protein|nr:hypothetical protein [Planctomycetota bacterium]